MLRLRVLGAIELRADDSRAVDESVLQPKRLALLTYLLTAAPGALHRRDDIAALFWPELDDTHARNALSQILHQLRRVLGPAAIVTRGASEIGVDPTQVWCDAVQLETALRQGALEHAFELYRGDLLKGFHVNASSEFEHWLDAHREHLRKRVAEAGWSLAVQFADRPPLALVWARRAYALAIGPDEAALSRVLQAYRAAGDVNGALREYERFERLLAAEYDAAPSAATRAIIEEMRSGRTPAERKLRRFFDVVAVDARHAAASPRRRHRVFATVGVAMLAVSVVTVTGFLNRRSNAESQTNIAIVPFSYRGSPQYEYLGEGLARMLTNSVGNAENVRTVDMRAVQNGRYKADHVVTGEIIEIEGKLRLNVAIRDVHSDRTVRQTLEARTDSAFELANVLTTRILAAASGIGFDVVDVAAQTTRSQPALREFVSGDEAYRNGNYKQAAAHYGLAVAQDSQFALAYYRLSRAANWTGEFAVSTASAERAVTLRNRLPEPARTRVLAWYQLLNGHIAEAEPLYRFVIRKRPTDFDALQDLADLKFHWGGSVGQPAQESRELWERVLSLDPKNADAITHLLRILARTRDLHAFESWQEELERMSQGADRTLEARALHAFAFGTDEQRAQIARQFQSLDRAVMVDMVETVASSSDRPGDVARLLVPVIYAHSSFSSREAGHMMLQASLELASGRVSSAWAVADSVGQLDPERAQEFRAVFASLAFPAASPARIAQVSKALDGPTPPVVRHRYIDVVRPYLRGLLAVRANDSTAVTAAIAQLRGVRGKDDLVRYADLYARILGAEQMRNRGRPQEALKMLGAPAQIPDGRRPYIWSYGKAEERWLRAQLLLDVGRKQEALRWLATFPDVSSYDVAYLPMARLQEARIRESLGDRDGAALSYLRFMTMWRDADGENQRFVLQARRSYEHLGLN